VFFDEAHKYIESQDLVTGLVEVVREMRHKGTSILVASQDPPSVPTALIELSPQVILHKFNSGLAAPYPESELGAEQLDTRKAEFLGCR
jgi:hypothetical protein